MRTYKAALSRQAKRDLFWTHIWQWNFYEHIVRNQVELEDITKYIYTNPQNWLADLEYSQ
jgi:putative transposase